MNTEQAIGELTVKATMLQGIPMVSLEDCTRVIQKMGKTEQEVREAMKDFEVKFIIEPDKPIYWGGSPVKEVMSLSTIAVIIGKAFGGSRMIGIHIPTNDFNLFKHLLMNFEYEDLNNSDLKDLKNMLENLKQDCEDTLRGRGIYD